MYGEKTKKRKRKKLRIILILIGLLLLVIGRPLVFLIYTHFKDPKPLHETSKGYASDAGHLEKTKIDSIVSIDPDTEKAIVQVRELIRKAKTEDKKISIAGAQHSMGGHTIYPNGIVLNMRAFNNLKIDTVKNILCVEAGALWSEIIPFLDKYKRSVSVMQSNNSFSVGGSISVNCHGWQPNSPPIASTVESFRLIDANGNIIQCSRSENPELFSLVLGGYGLFGVVLDVKLHVVKNSMYETQQKIIKSSDYIKEFNRFVTGNDHVGMCYGRININPDHFMEEAILSVFIIDEKSTLEPIHNAGYKLLRRIVFRGSANSNYGKDLRWKAEKLLTSKISGKRFSRNQLLNEGVETFQNTDTAYTDILHEYFIPKDSVAKFIEALKLIIPKYDQDLLNITVRNVKHDEDSYLRYAKDEVFGFVMLFNQARTEKAEEDMVRLTQALANKAISMKGTYYLPYRLHPTKEQMYAAYPQAGSFFALKKKYDPTEVFQNKFYEKYR